MKLSRLPRLLFVASAAATLLVQPTPALADGVRPDVATPAQREKAQSRFLHARDLMGKNRYDEALAEFRASREIVVSPNTRLEIARCLRAEGKVAAAYAELGRTEVEAKELAALDSRYQRAYDAALAERIELEPQVGFVVLTIDNASDTTRVIVGGEELRRAAWSVPAPADPGATDVLVETPGQEAIKKTVRLSAGQRISLVVDARPDEANPSPQGANASASASTTSGPRATRPSWVRTGAYVAGSLGVAGVATFAIFGLLARAKYDELDRDCGSAPCPPDKAGDIASGKTNQIIANLGLVVGLAGAAAGGTMFLLSTPSSSAGAAYPSAHGLRGAFVVAPSWVGLRGDF